MKMAMIRLFYKAALSAIMITTASSALQAWTIDAVRTEPAFDLSQKNLVSTKYTSLEPSAITKKWNVCLLLPHTDNPFMVSVLYGGITEAQRLKIQLEAKSAGGYENVARQIDQVESCVTRGAQAIVLVSVSRTGLNDAIAAAAARGVVVIDTINGVTSDKITGRVVTSYGKIGETFGKYLAGKHPAGSGKVKTLYMAGPAGASYVGFMESGFRDAIKGSDIDVVKSLYAASSKAAQFPVVEDGLLAFPDVKYVVGNAPAIEAAYDILRDKGRKNVGLVAGFVTPQTLALVESGDVEATVSASEVMQPAMAIDLAVRALEKKLEIKDVAPNSFIISRDNIKTFDKNVTIAPAGWKPVFNVD
ncbi:TMAO reductase system periplasmic protein TorT [Pseudorhodoplanes sp.]|uniref:TMAO reductase system periplasmic protein TorT n=1 Tax=Pseudorhodoplanes sp. TaxID=1934341 RepID=UPI003D0D7864